MPIRSPETTGADYIKNRARKQYLFVVNLISFFQPDENLTLLVLNGRKSSQKP